MRDFVRRISRAVIGRMAVAFVAALLVAIAAQAASEPDSSAFVRFQPIAFALLGGLVSGAIQWGAVRQTIREHERRIEEVGAVARRADERMATHIDAWHRGD